MAEQLISQITQAITTIGRRKQQAPRNNCGRTHKLYFDDECRRMKREVKQAWQAGADSGKTKELERSYHNLVRAKKRRHMKNTLRELLSERVKDPRKFWKKLRHHPTHLPPQLHSVLTWQRYVQNLTNPVLPPNCHLPDDAYPTNSTSLAVCLNVPIQTQEVQDHLSRLHNGKAAGRLGLHSELLRYACKSPTQDEPKPVHKLIVPLTALFNAFFAEGFIPASLNHALITSVYKKGSRTDTRNYRPIAVIEPLIKLYSSILNARMIQFTEDNNLRAPSQAGFRPNLSTLHPLMSLQHFLDKHLHKKRHLFCCFLDLKAAYDSIQRPLLWEVLARLGVHGQFLATVQSLYQQCTYSIKVEGRSGASFESQAGVKQGCPFSPTLFGLVADGLHRALLSQCPHVGPQLENGECVPILQYADDIVLMAATASDLQLLVNAGFCFLYQCCFHHKPWEVSGDAICYERPIGFPIHHFAWQILEMCLPDYLSWITIWLPLWFCCILQLTGHENDFCLGFLTTPVCRAS